MRGVLFVGIGCAVGCAAPDPAQLVVVIDSDLAVPAELDEVEAQLLDEGGAVRSRRPFLLGDPPRVGLPASFGVAPLGGDVTRPVHLRVVARRAGGELFATEVRTGFVPGELRRLHVFLARRCLEERCGPGLTCRRDGCEDVAIDPTTLPVGAAFDAGPRPRDGGADDGAIRDGDALRDGATLVRCTTAPCFEGVECVDGPAGPTCGACPPGTEGDGASCADLDRCAEVGCAECADAPAPGDGFSCGECPAGTVDGASGCAVPVCAGARLCAAAASADVLSRTLDVLPSGANLYFGQGVSTHRGFAIPIGAFPCCVFPGTATAGIALASERPIEWAPLATADPASYVLHPGLASQGSRLLLINPLDYASTVPVSLPSLAAEATLPSDVAGTSGAPPALLRLAGGSFAALVAQPLEPMRLRRLDAALRTIDEEVVASSEARFGALTPTCHGNALATWWTGAGTAAQPLDATGHRIGMVSSVASHAPDATHRPAVFDGRVVVTPGRDEILEIDADGVFVTRTPAPNALAAFGTDEGLLVLVGEGSLNTPVQLLERETGRLLRVVGRISARFISEAAVGFHVEQDGSRAVYFATGDPISRGSLHVMRVVCE